MIICVFGLPGSGKSYQSHLLAKDIKGVHLIASDILKEKLQKKEVDVINSGGLVDNDIVKNVVFEKIDDIKKDNKIIILDGYPRTVDQLISMMDRKCNSIFILLSVPDNVCIRRISKRKSKRLDDSWKIAERRIQIQKDEIFKMEGMWKHIVKIDGVGTKSLVQERIKNSLKNLNLI